MIKQLEIENNRIVESTRGAGQIMVVSAPDDNERGVVREQCALDTYDMNSTLDPDEVPRVDFTDGRLFLIWKVPEAASVSEAIDLAVSTVDHALGLLASTLIRDGGTLQIGIGSLGDAIAYATRLRHEDNTAYRGLLADLELEAKFGDAVASMGQTGVFEKGLYGASEIDLRDAELSATGAGVNVFTFMGQTTIRIPKGWTVLSEQTVVAGSLERTGGDVPEHPLGTIHLTGATLFGATVVARDV